MELSAAITQYLDVHRGRGDSLLSLKTLRSHLGQLERAVGDWPTLQDLMRWQAAQRNARTTVHHKVKSAKAFLRWAHAMGYIHDDVASQLSVPARSKRLPRILDDDMVDLLLRGAWEPDYSARDRCLVERDRLLVRTFMLTGLRRAEICSINVGDLDRVRRRLRVRGKGDRDRVIPLPAGLDLGRLCEGRRPSAPLFSQKNGKRLDPNAVSYVFTRKVSGAVGARVTPHMLRHSYATYLCRRGVPLRQIQQLLGHSSLATTQIYLDVTAQDLEQAVSVLDQLAS